MLTIADKGGGVRKIFNNGSLGVLKLWIQKRIDVNYILNIGQSQITCKLDPNKWISPMLSFQKVFGKVCCSNGALPKSWQKLTKGGGGVSQLLTKADKGGRGGQLKADICWQRGGRGVYEPPFLADVICEQPLIHAKVLPGSVLYGEHWIRLSNDCIEAGLHQIWKIRKSGCCWIIDTRPG